jgi:hypothetical protein
VQVEREAKRIESGKKLGATAKGRIAKREIGRAAKMDVKVEELWEVEPR